MEYRDRPFAQITAPVEVAQVVERLEAARLRAMQSWNAKTLSAERARLAGRVENERLAYVGADNHRNKLMEDVARLARENAELRLQYEAASRELADSDQRADQAEADASYVTKFAYEIQSHARFRAEDVLRRLCPVECNCPSIPVQNRCAYRDACTLLALLPGKDGG